VSKRSFIPVIDLFAGPGGLGEGFNACRTNDGEHPFRIALSIEKDRYAHSTLRLRSFFRQFGNKLPSDYYSLLSDTNTPLKERLDELFARHPIEAEQAESEAWLNELGKYTRSGVRDRISSALSKAEHWVLIGGPPCQAYSLAGRSRNKGNADYVPHKDHRQFLYIEYLQVIAEHRPSVFIMENVKGLLSATIKNQGIFDRILSDLRDPVQALRREYPSVHVGRCNKPAAKYVLFSLTDREKHKDIALQDYVVRMENYGVPQMRHRLILMGVRADLLKSKVPDTLLAKPRVPAKAVLNGLPPLRSGLSKSLDNAKFWKSKLNNIKRHDCFISVENSVNNYN